MGSGRQRCPGRRCDGGLASRHEVHRQRARRPGERKLAAAGTTHGAAGAGGPGRRRDRGRVADRSGGNDRGHAARRCAARGRGTRRRHDAAVRSPQELDRRPTGRPRAPPPFSSSVSDAQYYGVSLLTRTGYCSNQPAFWTDRSWPEARSTCCRIAERLQGFSAQIPAAETARRRLAEAYPVCGSAAQGGG